MLALVTRYAPNIFGGRLNLTQEQIDSLLTRHETVYDDSHDNRQWKRMEDRPLDDGVVEREVSTFPFDPNTADTTALLSLGFQRWMIRGMLKYRAAGGRYREVDDVKRIPGMTPELFDRISSYITIDEKFKPYDRATLDAERQAKYAKEDSVLSAERVTKLPVGARIDINTADSALLCQVPGIGAWRARQIIRRREALGGYISVSQLTEIEDIPDSCLQWFDVKNPQIRRINVNKATLTALKRHPYIGALRAVAIDRYRRTRGTIRSIDELRFSNDFTEEDIKRLQDYVEY